MPALNFQKQFAEAVESGAKRQTIRATRKRPIVVLDTLYLYTGMRTKACRKLGEAICISTESIRISAARISIDGRCLSSRTAMFYFAKKDGFSSLHDMLAWFKRTHGLPFEGQLIRWGNPCPPGN